MVDGLEEGFAPDFLGAKETWHAEYAIWGRLHSFVDEREYSTKYKTMLPDLEFYKNFSKNLPEWVYVYMAPSNGFYNLISQKMKDGYDFTNYPVVFHQGDAHYFIKP
jgi:hypothetical protein